MEDKIKVKMQNIFKTSDLEVAYVEMLVRPIDKNTSIEEFINYIDNKNKWLELDSYMITLALKMIKGRYIRNNIKIIVNISNKTIDTSEITNILKNRLNEYSINTNSIILKLSEMTNFDSKQVCNNIEEISNMGFMIALDSSRIDNNTFELTYYNKIDILKLQETYIDTEDKYEETRDIVEKLHKNNIETVIGGIGKREDLARAKKEGYRYMQGVLLEKPMRLNKYILKYSK